MMTDDTRRFVARTGVTFLMLVMWTVVLTSLREYGWAMDRIISLGIMIAVGTIILVWTSE